MEDKNYSFNFLSTRTSHEIFEMLLDVRQWWMGLFGEKIKGESKKIDDEFTFHAGDGVHYSKQRLIEWEADKKIVWQVIDSKLSFVEKTAEWTGTKISFEIIKKADKHEVVFNHFGLIPKFECYDGCAGAWTQYLEILKEKLI